MKANMASGTSLLGRQNMSLTDFERADLETMSSALICDAMEALNLPATVAVGFILMGKPGVKFAGPAVTLRQIPKGARDDRAMRMTKHRTLSREVAGKGDVVVVDNGGRLNCATWGEFHGLSCRQRGVAGVIIHGATRDGPEIRDSGLATFVRGLTPLTSKFELKTVSINEPVMLGDVEVCPGDIIFADETGIVVIPPAMKDAVLGKARELLKAEDAERAKVS
jgi:regulator of RNase E activity RraA